jgi:hypothetical protein
MATMTSNNTNRRSQRREKKSWLGLSSIVNTTTTIVGSSDTVKSTVPPKHVELNPTSAATYGISSSVIACGGGAPSPSSATSAMGNPALHQH